MKAPLRTPWQHTTEPYLNRQGELRATITDQHTRWKRKNRITRLKHTIAKLNAEISALRQENSLRHAVAVKQQKLISKLEVENILLQGHINKMKDFIDRLFKSAQ